MGIVTPRECVDLNSCPPLLIQAASAIAQEGVFSLKVSEDMCMPGGDPDGMMQAFPGTKKYTPFPTRQTATAPSGAGLPMGAAAAEPSYVIPTKLPAERPDEFDLALKAGQLACTGRVHENEHVRDALAHGAVLVLQLLSQGGGVP